jgi:acyl carrier protein
MTQPELVHTHILTALAAVLKQPDGRDPLEHIDISPQTEVATLPLDSIIGVEFLAELEDLMGIDLPPQLLLNSVLVEDLIASVCEIAATETAVQ